MVTNNLGHTFKNSLNICDYFYCQIPMWRIEYKLLGKHLFITLLGCYVNWFDSKRGFIYVKDDIGDH